MPLASNYGGTLQNYALQVVLKRFGHEPITLRFPSMYQNRTTISSLKLYLNLLCRYILKKILMRHVSRPLTPSAWRNNTSNFERFIKANINVTDYITRLSVDKCEKWEINALIVGSDQIWRPEVPYVIERYFCGFAKDSSIKRISYAASLALEKWTFNQEQTEEIRMLLQKFSNISVRESNGIELLKNNVHCDAQWVLDPTILLTKKDYLQLIMDIPKKTDNYIFTYILNPDEDKNKIIRRIATEKGLKVISLDDKALNPSSIECWLAHFRDADYIITDSFHGTVFSLLFEKQFICFENAHRGNARFESLKLLTGLNERFICECDALTENKINYFVVNEKIAKAKAFSLEYLKNSLEAI